MTGFSCIWLHFMGMLIVSGLVSVTSASSEDARVRNFVGALFAAVQTSLC